MPTLIYTSLKFVRKEDVAIINQKILNGNESSIMKNLEFFTY